MMINSWIRNYEKEQIIFPYRTECSEHVEEKISDIVDMVQEALEMTRM